MPGRVPTAQPLCSKACPAWEEQGARGDRPQALGVHPAVQMGTSLLCVLGILAAFHLPKCYLLLRQPAGNPPEFFPGGGPGSASGLGGSRGGAHDPATSPQCAQT